MKTPTLIQHQPPPSLVEGNEPLVMPIYQSVKFELESLRDTENAWAGRGGYHYSRCANPTVRALEELLASLQRTDDAVVVGGAEKSDGRSSVTSPSRSASASSAARSGLV